MNNQEIAQVLYQMAELLEILDVPFKPRAYQRAAMAVEILPEEVSEIYLKGGARALEEISGVGESIAEKITELLQTGRLKALAELKKKVPMDIDELMQVPGLGPKKIKLLYQKLKIKNLKELEKAIKEHKLCKIPTLGEITEKNFLQGVELVKSRPNRMLWGMAYPLTEEILSYLKKNCPAIRLEPAGSFRRGKETIGDLDILALSNQPAKVMDCFVKMPNVKEILAKGTTKSAVRLSNNFQVDIRVLKHMEFGSALMHFTGSKEHNIEMRKLALSKGYTLSEYGLFKLKGKQLVAGKTEEEIYQKLGLDCIPPELRENAGEIELAKKGKLPKLAEMKDVTGNLHTHTNWSDGSSSIEEMALAAEKLGWKHLGISDHVGTVGIAHPLDSKRLKKQKEEIEQVNKKLKGRIKVLHGAEIDISKDGSLAIEAKALKGLDFRILSVHSAFKMSEEEMTERICKALEENPGSILAHPSGRLIYQREPYAVNWKKVFETARKTGSALEINGMPTRLDLKDTLVKEAVEAGCKLVLGADAHSPGQLHFLKYALITARRGWAEKKDLINCRDYTELFKLF